MLDQIGTGQTTCSFSGLQVTYALIIDYLLTLMFMWGSAWCRGLKAEKIAARQAILPLIQAEEDARYVEYFLLCPMSMISSYEYGYLGITKLIKIRMLFLRFLEMHLK